MRNHPYLTYPSPHRAQRSACWGMGGWVGGHKQTIVCLFLFACFFSLEFAHCTVVIKVDGPMSVHLPGSRQDTTRTGRPIRSGGGAVAPCLRFSHPSTPSWVHAVSYASPPCSNRSNRFSHLLLLFGALAPKKSAEACGV